MRISSIPVKTLHQIFATAYKNIIPKEFFQIVFFLLRNFLICTGIEFCIGIGCGAVIFYNLSAISKSNRS
jgi:hypothetical protein